MKNPTQRIEVFVLVLVLDSTVVSRTRTFRTPFVRLPTRSPDVYSVLDCMKPSLRSPSCPFDPFVRLLCVALAIVFCGGARLSAAEPGAVSQSFSAPPK